MADKDKNENVCKNSEEMMKVADEMIAVDDRKTILIVDDVRANVYLVENILCDEFKIISASNAAEMWRILKRNKPDLLLLDIMMPYENGFEVLQKIKKDEVLSKIPVIVVSAKDSKEDVVKALSLGAVDYISKPIKEEVIVAKIHKILQIQ
jgi:PleD family two-component response regulator